jgi:hypothetical protein
VYTSFEMTAVVDTYFDWLDHYGSVNVHTPTTADVEARCLALPGASPSQCNFDTDFQPLPLTTRVPARPDWYEAARNPLP